MDFERFIRTDRPYGNPGKLQGAVESDRGRIINSAAIRRLQQKTQVFPLERNAAVRSRLTHSLEVQQVGRFITQTIFKKLHYKNQLTMEQFHQYAHPVESLVEMACLMHDIGNPPFGHFGEKAISDWFVDNIEAILPEDQGQSAELYQKMRQDLLSFEGNAQAMRLIFSLLKLNLTYTQSAAILKYTRPAYVAKGDAEPGKDYLMKKPGYYLSEEQEIEKLRSTLGLDYGCRHPLSYIMEAADDISYCYADIEDAVEKGILSVEQLLQLLSAAIADLGLDPAQKAFVYFGSEKSFDDLLMEAKASYDKEKLDKANSFFVTLRVKMNHILVEHAASKFVDHLDEVEAGTYNGALLEDNSPAHKLTEAFKNVALAHVFSHSEVELQELRGFQIINGLLDYYQPLLKLEADAFQGLLNKEWRHVKDHARESRLANKLPAKHRRAYEQGLKPYTDDSNYPLWERYFRCRLMQDFISGMTDQYAFDEYKSLHVAD